jgi:hypothetical protein
LLRNKKKNLKSDTIMNTSAYIQDTNEDIRIDYQQHNGRGTDNPAQQYDLNEYATMELLQRGHQLVNEHILHTAGIMGCNSRNDLKESGHMNESQHIHTENKMSGHVPGSGSTPQSETRRAPRKLRGNKNPTPKAHAADMTMAPASIPSLHPPMENQHGK